MYFSFSPKYVSRQNIRVAMFVSNPVIRDSRVVKTAQTVKKLGFSFVLYGWNIKNEREELLQYEFPIVLLPNPGKYLKQNQILPTNKGEQHNKMANITAQNLANEFDIRYPDILHTHDMFGLTVGGLVTGHYFRYSECPFWLHDVHEYTAGATHIPTDIANYHEEMEKKYIYSTDFLTTVSNPLKEILEYNYQLKNEITVVYNTPRLCDFDPLYPNDVRSSCGLSYDAPLVVYCGGVSEIRGLSTMINALSYLDDVHLAIVTATPHVHLKDLKSLVSALEVSNRVHFLDDVPFYNLTSFLRSADIGVHPMHVFPNGEIALPNKVFEYIHAGLVPVVSNNKEMQKLVENIDYGYVFEEKNYYDLANKIKLALNDRKDCRNNMKVKEQINLYYCWESQEEKIEQIYSVIENNIHNKNKNFLWKHKTHTGSIVQVPLPQANQNNLLAQALFNRGNVSKSINIKSHRFIFPIYEDVQVNKNDYKPTVLFDECVTNFDIIHYHVRTIFHRSDLEFPTGIDVVVAKALSRKAFFHFRGSEIRIPSVAQKNNKYRYETKIKNTVSEHKRLQYRNFLNNICDATFVVDPELQTYSPTSLIVPRAFDFSRSNEERCAAKVYHKTTDFVTILHAPSKRGVKGTGYIVNAISNLKEKSVPVELKFLENVNNKDVNQAIKYADIVIDQVIVGWYGFFAVEAMSQGKPVISYIRDDIKHYLPYPFPIANANPENIESVIELLVYDEKYRTWLGERGLHYAHMVHDANNIAENLEYIYSTQWNEGDASQIVQWFLIKNNEIRDRERINNQTIDKLKRQKQNIQKGMDSNKSKMSIMKKRYNDLCDAYNHGGVGSALKLVYRFIKTRIKKG